MTSVLRITSYPDAEISLNHPRHDHREEAKDEGEDGGQEEAPPLPLHQALLIVDERDALVFGKDDVAVTILWKLYHSHRGQKSRYYFPSAL